MKINGGDGSSIEQAIVISDCKHADGINQEYIECFKRFGNYKRTSQQLLMEGILKFDVLTIIVNDEKKDVYFDITDFFGTGTIEEFMEDLKKSK